MGEDASAEQLPVRPVLQVRPEARSLPAIVSAFHPFGSCRVAKIVQGESRAKEKRVFLFALPSRRLSWRSRDSARREQSKRKNAFFFCFAEPPPILAQQRQCKARAEQKKNAFPFM